MCRSGFGAVVVMDIEYRLWENMSPEFHGGTLIAMDNRSGDYLWEQSKKLPGL
jgi:hypothetical protein